MGRLSKIIKKKGFNFFNDRNYFQSLDYNQRAFYLYRDWLYSLALLRFKWINLPQNCDERYLEWCLFFQGVATIATPRRGLYKGRWYSTQITADGQPNIYDNPVKWTSFGNNGWRFKVTPLNGVLIYDNVLRIPLISKLDYIARRLAMYDRTNDINLMNQHKPVILACPQTLKNDAIQIYKQFAGGEPAILGYDKLGDLMDDIKVLDLQVEFLGKQLNEAKQNLWNEAYQLLGIENLPKKSERMIEDEVLANNDVTDLRALDGLRERRMACKKLNDRFDLNIDVVWNKDLKSDNYNFVNNIEKRYDNE